MEAFKAAAKLTQHKYGTIRNAANLDLKAKAKIVAAMASHMAVTSISPNPGERAPKNRTDQARFNNSWPKNKIKAALAFPAFHTSQAATAIKI